MKNNSVLLLSVKGFGAVLCLLLLITNILSISVWSEARGVYDDICYLRQAHLFKRFGISGFHTDISRDDDNYLSEKLREIGFSDWKDPRKAPCHNVMQDNKFVLQYPPGTGFVLALFPQSYQVSSLYAFASLIVCGFAILGISLARSVGWSLSTIAFGLLTLYLMITPGKASYSVPPTMVVCALVGYMTASWLCKPNRGYPVVFFIGLLLGLSVNLRIANALLSAGYFFFFAMLFFWSRTLSALMQGVSFGAAFLLGLTPTLVYNAINAGGPFTTTYGGMDVARPEFKLDIVLQYAGDMQFALVAIAFASVIYVYYFKRKTGQGLVAFIVTANLSLNLAYFFTHPVATPYYVLPIAMLSLWSLSFAQLVQEANMASLDIQRSREMKPEAIR